jgi:hypothetical protein
MTAEVDSRALDSGAAFAEITADPGPVGVRGLAIAAAIAAGVYTPGEGDIDDAIAACIVMDGLTEKIEKLVINDSEGHNAGTIVEYQDGYYGADGEKVATVTGKAVVVATEPHMWQFHFGHAELADGTWETTGFLDAAAIMKSMTQILHIRGTGGRYAGKAGYLSMSVADLSQRPPLYSVSLALC